MRCDVWIVCACFACALSLVSLVFGQAFFGGSASLHDRFLHFLAKCCFCNLYILVLPSSTYILGQDVAVDISTN